MEQSKFAPWPEPPARIADKWPDGFPKEGSEEFNSLIARWSASIRSHIGNYLQRELSLIDACEITGHTRDVFREYFSGNYGHGPYEEVSSRYYNGVFGYAPEDIFWKMDGSLDERSEKLRHLFHRLHARAHHE